MMRFWKKYQPGGDSPWNLARVWMLHRRAGFGANWETLQRDLTAGMEQSVSRVLNSDEKGALHSAFEENSEQLLKMAIKSNRINRLSSWWIGRMYLGPNPFQERQTLMWHNHFATSNRVVQNLYRMYVQNQIFREHGQANFQILLDRVIKDPAMLVWLNANDNRRGHPNENLGRELLELFSLGIGNYTENDVKESARALAGWTVNTSIQTPTDPYSENFEDKMSVRRVWRDEYEKTILGKTGYWDGNDLVQIVLNHPATARRLAWRICDQFFGGDVVSEGALKELASGIAQRDLNIKWAIETVLTSQLFYSDTNLKSKIAAPETFVLGTLKSLDTTRQPASTLALSHLMTTLGRSLFQPPNVGGWDGGRDWLNARTVVARSNFVHAVTTNGLNRNSTPPDFDRIVDAFGVQFDESIEKLFQLLLGVDIETNSIQPVLETVKTESKKQPKEHRWRFASQLLLNSSFAQLC